MRFETRGPKCEGGMSEEKTDPELLKVLQQAFADGTKKRNKKPWHNYMRRSSAIGHQKSMVRLVNGVLQMETIMCHKKQWRIVISAAELIERAGALIAYPSEAACIRDVLDLALCFLWSNTRGEEPDEEEFMKQIVRL